MGESFLAWKRSAVYGLGGSGPLIAGRLQAGLELKLTNPKSSENAGGTTAFEIVGPADITGFLPAAIKARMPAPGATEAIETKAAHIEFNAEDLPWRYTPALAAAGKDPLRPWLVLVVGKPESELKVLSNSRVRIEVSVQAKHNLVHSHRWAHVHDLGGQTVSRLLSPVDLEANTDYVAALVPAFRMEESGPLQLVDAWTGGEAVQLPCFDSWTFRTGPEEDFAQLAVKLTPRRVTDLPNFAVASVRYDFLERSRDSIELGVNGALMRVPTGGEPTEAPQLPPTIRTEVGALATSSRMYQGRWVLTVPRYDDPWPTKTPGTGWREEIAADPRRRGAAGLGAWAGMAWQQRIADAAAKQAGALLLAAQRIRHLTFGLASSRSIWNRRLPPATDPLGRLAVLGISLSRLPAGAGSALEAIDGRTPRMVGALFSSAARRVFRSGPARSALARPGANRFTAILEAANRCPEVDREGALDGELAGIPGNDSRGPGPDTVRNLLDDARHRAGDHRDLLDRLLDQLPGWIREGLAFPPNALLEALEPGDGRAPDVEALRRVLQDLPREPDTTVAVGVAAFKESVAAVLREPEHRAPACRPLDLAELGRRVSDAMDPTVDNPLVVQRVLGTLKGLKPPFLAPPEFEPELDLPLWKFLDESARDWLLPGAGTLEPHSVVAVQSNPIFVEALLLGANQQVLGELRWRNLPVSTGWTPMRRFWQRIVLDQPGKQGGPDTDIRPVAQWTEGTALGALSHWVDPKNAAQLVIVFRTDLFRRFPSTVVYLAPAGMDANGDPDWKAPIDLDDAKTVRVHATMTGSVGPEVVFFGFSVPPQDGRKYWVVLEEPPPGYRFYTENPPAETCDESLRQGQALNAPNSAVYAKATYALPVRVIIGNLLS